MKGIQKAIADATVLIHLAKIGKFGLLKMYDVTITKGVFQEVCIRGKDKPGERETRKAIKDKWISTLTVKDKEGVKRLSGTYEIGLANAETLVLAIEMRVNLILTDDAKLRALAEELKIAVKGALGIMLDAVRNNLISSGEAESCAEILIKRGYRISDEVISEFKKKLEDLKLKRER